jgi:hypothetical protein
MTLSRTLKYVAPLGVALLFVAIFSHHLLGQESYYPPIPGGDEDVYLNTAAEFPTNFTVSQKSPLYTMWLGAFYYVCGGDKQSTFWAERYASLIILSAAVGYLGLLLFDARTAAFLAFWVADCKYVEVDSNGSNPLAASLFVMSLICLVAVKGKARLPLAVLLLFLASLARPEMRLPLFAVLLFLTARAVIVYVRRRATSRASDKRPPHATRANGKDRFYKPFVSRALNLIAPADVGHPRGVGGGSSSDLNSRALYHWIVVVVIAASLSVFIHRNARNDSWSVGYAYFMAFAVNHAARTHTSHLYPHGWPPMDETIRRVLPQVPTPINTEMGLGEIIRAASIYPHEVIANFLYNVKSFGHVLPALMLGLHGRALWVLAFLLYAGSYYKRRGFLYAKLRRLPRQVIQELLFWGASAFMVIPATLLIFVEARYYFPLIPVLMCSFVALVRLFVARASPGD